MVVITHGQVVMSGLTLSFCRVELVSLKEAGLSGNVLPNNKCTGRLHTRLQGEGCNDKVLPNNKCTGRLHTRLRGEGCNDKVLPNNKCTGRLHTRLQGEGCNDKVLQCTNSKSYHLTTLASIAVCLTSPSITCNNNKVYTISNILVCSHYLIDSSQ